MVCADATPRSIRVERKLGMGMLLRATVDVAMIDYREERGEERKTKASKQLGSSDSVALTYPDDGGRRVRWTEESEAEAEPGRIQQMLTTPD